jgi:DNA mismatch endonuclease (patch repair protein)
MADVFTKRKRSEVMARIRGHGNKGTEVALAKLLRAAGITGWRRNQTVLGKPDFVFRSQYVAVFVDGCFWHGCPKHSNMTVNNRAFWKKKLTANRNRDKFVTHALRRLGWRVVRIWEHDLNKRPEKCVERIRRSLRSS